MSLVIIITNALWNAFEDYHTPPVGILVYMYASINQTLQSEVALNLLHPWSFIAKVKNLIYA